MTGPRRSGGDRRGRSGDDRPRRTSNAAGSRPGRGENSRPSRPRADRAESTSRTERDAGIPVPEDADPKLLERSVRAELRSLSKPNADAVAKYLVAAGLCV